jgi:hypothetical protein
MVSRKSVPIRVVIASTVRTPASTTPLVKPMASTCKETAARAGSTPDETASHHAETVSAKVGTSSGLSRWRAYASHAAASRTSITILRSQPWL